MAGAGSNHIFALEEEGVAGTLPSPFNPTTLRILEGADFDDQRSALVSSELTGSSRQILSSTLGTPNPQWSPGVEYSFGSFDSLLEGALQNDWSANGYASGVTIDVAAGDTLTTDGGELWSSYGFADGDVITVTGLTASTEDGAYLIASGSGTDTITVTDLSSGAVTFTAETDATLTAIAGRLSTVVDTSANGLTVDATAFTITAASALWNTTALDLRFNDLIYLKGFSEANNNGYFKVVSATATVLTLNAESTLTNETISTGDVEVANNTAMLTVSNTKHNYSVLSGYEDVDQYRYMTGAQVSSMSISMATDSIVSGDFGFLGRYVSEFSGTSPATSVANPTTTQVFNTFRGYISFDGSAPACLLNLDINLDNNSEGLQCLFTSALDDITHGRSNVSGSFSAYFEDEQLANLYANETLVNIFTVMEDADGNSIGIGIPRAQLQSDTFQINETTVEESLDFQALGGDTTYTNIYIINSRAIPA